MKIVSPTAEGLYSRLLNGSWPTLDQAIRRLHSARGVVHAVGAFRVRRSQKWLPRSLARLARLPAAADVVTTHLTITPRDGGEVWLRLFGKHALVSRQWQRNDSLLAEQKGILELHFRLEVVDGSLCYQTNSAALHLGPMLVPLPRWLTPDVTAREESAADGQGIHVEVQVHLPLLGFLTAYDGNITVLEAEG